jgi:D-alanyl-D-alanine carboxypeptidase (penicillin-binding protein 5/6)
VIRLAAPAAAAAVAFALASAPATAQASSAQPACPSTVHAPSAIVIEVSTGTVACARAPDRQRPVGSTTKLMTALLTLERAKLSEVCTAADYHPAPIESQIGLVPGQERMKVSDLLRGLLAESGNDAAATLAQCVGGTRHHFIALMNQRARQLGLTNTHYENPIGLDAVGNYSSARDLVTLATVLRTNTFFKKIVDSPQVTLKTGIHPRTFTNRNRLVVRYPFVNGVKTGHTSQAGYVLVGSASRNGVQLISAVLDTPSEDARDEDTMALFRFAFKRYERIRPVIKGVEATSVPIRFRRGARLKLKAARTVRRIVLRGHRAAVSTIVHAPAEVSGPIHAGQRLGSIEVRQGGETVATVPLIAASAVPAADIAQKTKSWARGPWVLIGGLAAIVGTLLLARRRRIRSSRRPSREASAA